MATPWLLWIGLSCVVAAADSAGPAEYQGPIGVDDCVAAALQDNATLGGQGAKVHEMQARLDAVRSIFWPKLVGVALVAPMYTVRGNGYSNSYELHYGSLSDWGAYTNLDLTVVQPLFSFGRATAGAQAAHEQLKVERAKLDEVRAQVALEVRTLYYTHLFAQSMLPTLEQAIGVLAKARGHASALYDKGTGEVTQVDLAKLDYGSSEAKRFLLIAQNGASLAKVALQHVMGQSSTTALILQDRTMPPRQQVPPLTTFDGRSLPPEEISLEILQRTADLQRSEWQQLYHGKKAARAWQRAEKLANLPVLFLAGQVRYGYAPTRDRDSNPWHFDNYNTASGGVALGLKFDLDPALAAAKAQQAAATEERVEALHRQAQTGIAVQVRKAHDELQQARQTTDISEAGLVATRQWMTSAANAYQTNMGEARDLLEGLAAYVQAKRSLMESLRSYHLAAAELRHAVGGIY
jgi:outer membrane protein